MTQILSEHVIPEDYDYKTPEHLIIWLDAHIGNPEKYHHLKKAFSSNVDPRSQTWTMLTDRDYDTLLRTDEAQRVSFGGILFLLLACSDPNACYAAFRKYSDRRILFITSGALGEELVPRIIQDFQKVFTDPVTNDPYNSIYIFCGNIRFHSDWARQYLDYIQIFDHEADLLLRMTRDIAEYYSIQGKRQREDNNLQQALRFYIWSKKLFNQYAKMGEPCRKDIQDIDRITSEIEDRLRSEDDNDERACETCS